MKCKDTLKVKYVLFINPSDIKKTDDGSFQLKRKYGKFKREVKRYDYKD